MTVTLLLSLLLFLTGLVIFFLVIYKTVAIAVSIAVGLFVTLYLTLTMLLVWTATFRIIPCCLACGGLGETDRTVLDSYASLLWLLAATPVSFFTYSRMVAIHIQDRRHQVTVSTALLSTFPVLFCVDCQTTDLRLYQLRFISASL